MLAELLECISCRQIIACLKRVKQLFRGGRGLGDGLVVPSLILNRDFFWIEAVAFGKQLVELASVVA